jgi:hypothetical protein
VLLCSSLVSGGSGRYLAHDNAVARGMSVGNIANTSEFSE